MSVIPTLGSQGQNREFIIILCFTLDFKVSLAMRSCGFWGGSFGSGQLCREGLWHLKVADEIGGF